MRGLLNKLNERWRGALGVVLFALGLTFLLALTPFATFFSNLSFDLLTVMLPEQRANNLILLVLDEKSFLDMKQDYTRIWSRGLHANLLSKLKADGARGVVFDVVFFESGPPAEDARLAQAMKAHGRVAIAMDHVQMAGTGIVGTQPRFPLDVFRQAAAAIGMVRIIKERDGVVRRHFDEPELFRSLPWAAAEITGAKLSKESAARMQPRWLRFPGPAGSAIPRLSYVDAFSQAPGFFRNKVIFIGGAPKTKLPGQEVDTFRTPYSRWNGEDAPGVEILATTYLNLVDGNWLNYASGLLRFGMWLAAILVPCVFILIRKAKGRLILLCAVVPFFVILPVILGLRVSVWFPWLDPLLILSGGCAFAALLLKRSGAQLPAVVLSEMKPVSLEHQILPPVVNVNGVTVVDPAPAKISVPDHDLVKLVGRGAYGEVWLAKNAIGSWHAVKITFRDRFRDLSPFDREFRGIQRFMPVSRSHPGFVHVLHVGRNDAGGYFYCIMEAADDEKLGREVQPETYSARSLSSELKSLGRLPLKECVRVSLLLTEALGFLHQKNLIHRDIKPGNIIYVDNCPKLADIGLVTGIAEGDHKVSYLGTRGYIAPEGPGTPSADIFSLGKVIYEAGMGLDCDQFPELPTTLVENADDNSVHLIRLNQIVLKACEPNVKERYQTAAELHNDLLVLSKLL